jgi:crossover junction endodeoxyribonuclease RusA
MEFSLPWPPSVNHYYRRVGPRTLISREGREYRKRICELLPRIAEFTERLVVLIDAYPPDRRRRDLDNIQKPLLDALEHAGVYENDSQIDWLYTRRREVAKGGRVDVTITPAPLQRCPICGGRISKKGKP